MGQRETNLELLLASPTPPTPHPPTPTHTFPGPPHPRPPPPPPCPPARPLQAACTCWGGGRGWARVRGRWPTWSAMTPAPPPGTAWRPWGRRAPPSPPRRWATGEPSRSPPPDRCAAQLVGGALGRCWIRALVAGSQPASSASSSKQIARGARGDSALVRGVATVLFSHMHLCSAACPPACPPARLPACLPAACTRWEARATTEGGRMPPPKCLTRARMPGTPSGAPDAGWCRQWIWPGHGCMAHPHVRLMPGGAVLGGAGGVGLTRAGMPQPGWVVQPPSRGASAWYTLGRGLGRRARRGLVPPLPPALPCSLALPSSGLCPAPCPAPALHPALPPDLPPAPSLQRPPARAAEVPRPGGGRGAAAGGGGPHRRPHPPGLGGGPGPTGGGAVAPAGAAGAAALQRGGGGAGRGGLRGGGAHRRRCGRRGGGDAQRGGIQVGGWVGVGGALWAVLGGLSRAGPRPSSLPFPTSLLVHAAADAGRRCRGPAFLPALSHQPVVSHSCGSRRPAVRCSLTAGAWRQCAPIGVGRSGLAAVPI